MNSLLVNTKNVLSLDNNFALEFYGYNFTSSRIEKKLYVKVPFAKKKFHDNQIILDDNKLNLISGALNNSFLSCFFSDRYYLYDISFRDTVSAKSIGFNFVDLKDSTFLEPFQAFKPFSTLGINPACKLVEKMQEIMFLQKPTYNPLSMIGVVYNGTEITSLKSYIRFNQEETPTSLHRGIIIKRIVKAMSKNNNSVEYFAKFSEKFEKVGFIFYFIGIDSYKDGSERYKLYFRILDKNNEYHKNLKGITALLSQFGFNFNNDIEDIFNQHNNGIWGLAVSTIDFNSVNGVQLYLYP